MTHGLVAVLIALLTAAATVLAEVRIFQIAAADRQFYWKFHSDWRGLFRKSKTVVPAFEAERLEPVLDAWYLDMDRLERLALQGKWEQALYGTRQLGCVFRNARLSRLQIQLLLRLPRYGRESYDLNEICAHLMSGDISDQNVMPVLQLIGDAVRAGNCLEQDHMKRLFTPLLQRYLRKLQEYDSVVELLDAVGVPLFQYCGGQIVEQNGNRRGELPKDTEGKRRFFDRLTTELARNRRAYVDHGTWYPIIRTLKAIKTDEATLAFHQIELCFFSRPEHLEKNNFYERIRKEKSMGESVSRLHPEQRKWLSSILGSWIVDENGRNYSASELRFLRELARKSRRMHYESGRTRRRPNASAAEAPADGGAPSSSDLQPPGMREMKEFTQLLDNILRERKKEDGLC